MSELMEKDGIIRQSLQNKNDLEQIQRICYSLSNLDRINVLREIMKHPISLSDLSLRLKIPLSNVSRYVDNLQEAQLIVYNYIPAKKGQTKVCSIVTNGINISTIYNKSSKIDNEEYISELPVGAFSECEVNPPCGMVGKDEQLIRFDNPNLFFSPRRLEAECIWFDSGFVSYYFPNQSPNQKAFSQLSFSFEICSEAVYYNTNWPSDITILVNDIELCTFISPGDFGGRRGNFTPKYWPVTSTQFGMLKNLVINKKGVFLDGFLVNDYQNINSLKLENSKKIKFTLLIKEDAIHKGGINIFGKNFGDYNQSIIMKIK